MERPQRHRRGVNHYSDDNPSTFTIKRRRGEQAPFPSTPPSGAGVPPSSYFRENSAERRAARAEGRRRQQRSSFPKSPEHPRNHVNHSNSNTAPTLKTKRGPGRPPNPNSKRRKRKLLQEQQLKNSNKKNSANTNGEGVTHDQEHQQQQQEIAGNKALSPPPQTDEIIAHAVSIQPVLPLTCPDRPTLAQRYPQLYQDDNKYHIVRTQASSAASSSSASGSSSSTTLNNWTRIKDAYKERWVPLQQQGGSSSSNTTTTREEQSLLALPPAPWTCFSVRKDDPLYFCVGDAAGNLLLYNSQPPAVCIQTVVTTAAKREAERPILWSQTTQKGVLAYPNSVGAVSWHRNVCVVWTRQEVEILDVVQHITLACLPLDSAGGIQNHLNHSPTNHINNNSSGNMANMKRPASFSFQSLDLHPSDSLLLWRPLRCRLLDAAKNTPRDGDEVGAVSLYCIDFSGGKEGVKRKVIAPRNIRNHGNSSDSNAALNQHTDFLCHGAVWDNHSRDEILAVISQPQEKDPSSCRTSLCRMTVEGEISQRTILPESGSVAGRLSTIYTDCVLEQYDDFLFLCTGRGIRCYETNRLTFLTVYGETVALHSKTVGWQACFWIPEPSYDPSELVISGLTGGSSSSASKNRQSCWIHRADHLAQQEQHRGHVQSEKHLLRQESNSSTQSGGSTNHNPASFAAAAHSSACSKKGNKLFSNMLLVGVPHPTRGPTELQSTLYVWKPGEVLPLTTLQAPPGGLLGLHIHHTHSTGWRLTCASAKLGQGWQLSPSFKSDFAGTMYPVGYQILNDNIEYLEDEGELDEVISIPQQHHHPHLDESPQRNREEYDLQKALKQSLVTAAEDKISVLLEDDDEVGPDGLERTLVPSIPDPSLREVFEEDDPACPKSPSRRVRSTPQALTLFPQYQDCKESATEQIQEQAKRRLQPPPPSLDASSCVQLQAMKMKGKRSRTATVDAMLQASVDPVLKYKMGLLHKQWGDPGGSRFLPISCKPVLTKESNGSGIGTFEPVPPSFELNQQAQAPLEVPSDISVVAQNKLALKQEEKDNDNNLQSKTSTKQNGVVCAACHGRMVVHTCGRRELPVDTEALERAERARKEQEQAEQKRLRAERRRLAEAKRRENRRKKKEIEDRRLYAERMEEERRLRAKIEEEQELERKERHAAVLRLVNTHDPDIRQQQQRQAEQQKRLGLTGDFGHYQLPASLVTTTSSSTIRPSIPKFSELRTTNGCNNNSNGSLTHGYSTAAHGFYSQPAAAPVTVNTDSYLSSAEPAVSSEGSSGFPSLSNPTSSTTTSMTTASWGTASDGSNGNGNYYKKSETAEAHAAAAVSRRDLTTTFTASDGDALAALVGLADSLAPVRTTTAQSEGHYDYSGSSDRRSAILAQYSSQFKQLEASLKPDLVPTITYEHPGNNPASASARFGSTSVGTMAAATLRFVTTNKSSNDAVTTYTNGSGVVTAPIASASHDRGGPDERAATTASSSAYSSNNNRSQVWADRPRSNLNS